MFFALLFAGFVLYTVDNLSTTLYFNKPSNKFYFLSKEIWYSFIYFFKKYPEIYPKKQYT